MTWFAARVRDLPPLSEDVARPLTALIAFFATLALAWLSYRFLETPFLRLKDRYFGAA